MKFVFENVEELVDFMESFTDSRTAKRFHDEREDYKKLLKKSQERIAELEAQIKNCGCKLPENVSTK